MLPFMKDQHGEENSAPEEGGQVQDGAQDQGYYTVSGQEKKVRNSTVFFMTLFAIGALGLWFMVHKSKALRGQSCVGERRETLLTASGSGQRTASRSSQTPPTLLSGGDEMPEVRVSPSFLGASSLSDHPRRVKQTGG